MPYTRDYAASEPRREAIDALPGALLLEFGTPWCGHCVRAQPAIEQALGAEPALSHLKIEDGPGRRLGRSFRIKLWPTLVFLRDGVEVERLVRPTAAAPIAAAAARTTAG